MAAGEGAGLQGSFVVQKTGPLPNWAWMAIGLAAALGYAAWKRSKEKAKENPEMVSPSGVSNRNTGSANGITYAFVDADSTVNTLYGAPPGGGRPQGPPKPPPPTPAPDGAYVDVTQWQRKNAPWNSTLYGIAEHEWGDGDAWRKIWYAPQNKRLREMRSTGEYEDKGWENIQPGDKIWVPNVPSHSGGDHEWGGPGRKPDQHSRRRGGSDYDEDEHHRSRSRERGR
jgi:hypothetical protein